MSVNFTIPALGQNTAQSFALTSGVSGGPANPIVPALAAPNNAIIPQGNGKALVSISGTGATYQQFSTVYYAVSQAPVANTTCPALVAGSTYVIEGFAPGDKIAFLSNRGIADVTVTRIG